MPTSTPLNDRIEAVRSFNRFYTRKIGVLTEAYLKSPYTLAEARVIYEIAHHEKTTATELGRRLSLDAGYLSRILRSLKKHGVIEKRSSETDRRLKVLRLTSQGQQAFASLNTHAKNEIETMLGKLSEEDQKRVVDAMQVIQHRIDPAPKTGAPYLLRPHQPGDMGWVVHRHGALYAQEYGWDEHFEALVAEIVAAFIRNYDPKKERCWIAERDGANVGSVFLVKKSPTIAKLRLLLVEPDARGMGIGSHLVDECLRFARRVGYQRITLWTNSILLHARNIYQKAGFERTGSEPHHSFGHDLISETWDRAL